MRFLPTLRAYGRNTRPLLAAIAFAILLLASATLQAAEKSRVEVWLINTRCAPVCGDWDAGKAQIAYWRLDENQQWAAETAVTFAKNDEKTPTIFLVHGNRTTNDEAVEFAWPIYCWLSQQAGDRSYRVAIWSWASERTSHRQRVDVQTKVSYCDSQSYYLADCLRQMKADVPISLVGYSLGARIIGGSLQLYGSGTLACRCLPELTADRKKERSAPIRVALIADASDCFVLAPGGRNELAASQAEEILVTRNVCDTALRWYPRLYGRGGPEAMGFTGPCCYCPENVRVFDATCCVGKSHSWEDYIYCPNLFATLPHYLFADEQ